jgi:hypothetical protein
MAVYNMSKMAAGVQPKALPSGIVPVISTAALATALLLNDTINALQIGGDPGIPTNFGPVMSSVALDCDALDAGNTLKFNVGDAGNAARYINQSTVGQAGGYQAPNVGGWLGYAPFSGVYGTYTTLSLQLYTIVVKCQTAPGNWANGTIRVKAEYTYDP